MTVVAKQRPVRGKMVSRAVGAGRQTIGPQRPALPAASSTPSVTASSRVSIPTPFAPPEAPPEPQPRGKPSRENRDPPPVVPRVSPRSQGRAPQRSIEAPTIVRQPPARARRNETFPEPVAPAPSKMAELRSTIARMQQRLAELEPSASSVSDLRDRNEIAAELLDEALDLLGRPDGVMTRRRLKQKLEEARKVLG